MYGFRSHFSLRSSLFCWLLLVALIASSDSAAQQTNRERIDSLKRDVVEWRHDSLKLNALSKLPARYWYIGLDSSLHFGNWALAFADSIEPWDDGKRYNKALGDAYCNLGAAFSIYEQPDTALVIYDLAEEVYARDSIMDGLASVYGNRSYDYFTKGWYEMAYETNAKCLAIYEPMGRKRNMALCYENMARAHGQYDRHEMATQFSNKALGIYREMDNLDGMFRAYSSLATRQRYFDKTAAQASVDSMLAIINRMPEVSNYMWIDYYNSYAKLESFRGNYSHAEELLRAGLDSANSWGKASHGLTIKRSLPAILNALGKYEECIEVSEEIIPILKSKGQYTHLIHNNQYLYRAYAGMGNYEKAYNLRIRNEQVSDSLAAIDRLNSLDQANAQFQVAEREKEVQLEAQKRELAEAKSKRTTQMALGGGFGLLLIGGMLVLNQRNKKRRVELEKENAEILLKAKEEEALQLQEVERLKSRFFANISHEFRTPLTLILGPAHNIKKLGGDEKLVAEADTIERNGQQLLHLIDQLLELSRLENRGIDLKEAPTNIERFVQRIVDVFEPIAKEKNIDLSVEVAPGMTTTLVDRDKLEKILFNFLSNAHKFTPPGGKVIARVSHSNDSYSISITDNGPGIQPEALEKIFDRFYQTEEGAKAKGSGIGLALAKELSELMAGRITAQSNPGVQTTFTVELPIKQSDVAEPEVDSVLSPAGIVEPAGIINNQVNDDDERPVLLLVEDNVELREYTRNLLASDYQVIEAPDGKQGLETAREFIPDIIITDVMMPDMDGNEMCGLLKSDAATNHIPIVMLTAKSSSANKITGLEVGADDYLLKPFNTRELQLKLENLLKLTRNNRSKYREAPGDSSKLEKAEPVDSFIIEVNSFIEQHLSDPEFSVERLAELVLMSRSQLFRKLKALTEQTPVVYIRRMRLHRAKELLQNSDQNVSEVCYAVGFSSPAYFSKAYKEEFGESPSEEL